MNLLFLYEIYIKLEIGLIICLISHKISIIFFFYHSQLSIPLCSVEIGFHIFNTLLSLSLVFEWDLKHSRPTNILARDIGQLLHEWKQNE